MSVPRYLWFAPHAGLWPSFRLEHRLAEALALDGRNVTMVHCRGILDGFCPVMAAERLHEDSSRPAKQRICKDCKHNVALTSAQADYASVDLEDYVTPAVASQARQVADSVTPENWSALEFAGLPIGRWSAYLTMLHHKLPEVSSSPAAWREYVSDVHDAVLVAAVMPAMLDSVDPTHAVVYNPLYPTTRVFAELSSRAGVQLIGIAAGSFIPGRYESAGIYQHIMASQTTTDSGPITQTLAVPCTPTEVRAVGAHLRELIHGNDPWVYSSAPSRLSPTEVRSRLGVRPDSSVVTVLVSSPDETRSSMLVDAEFMRDPENSYSDIPEFIAALVTAAAGMPELDVVFRLHPRLMPNKREQIVSPDLLRITEMLSDLPPNAFVNSAADSLSLYDVICISDAAVNQSSSAGLEFLLLGLAVVQYDPPRLGAYPRDFASLVERHDQDGLISAVRAAAADGWSLDRSTQAFRWYTAVLLRALLHLAPVDPAAAESTDADRQSDVETEPTPSTPLRIARAVLPKSVRESVSRRKARTARASTVPEANSDTEWTSEWLSRIDATWGAEPIWEPLIVRRGEGSYADERAAVAGEVVALIRLLGVQDSPGLGALRGAFDTSSGEQII